MQKIKRTEKETAVHGKEKTHARKKREEKGAEKRLKELQRECLALADCKIGVIERSEKALDTHLTSLDEQIAKLQRSLDLKHKDCPGSGRQFDSVNTSGLSGSMLTATLTRRRETKGSVRGAAGGPAEFAGAKLRHPGLLLLSAKERGRHDRVRQP